MQIPVSQRVRTLGAYAFAAVDEQVARLRAQGLAPIDFGVGDPTDPTPAFIRDACRRALDARASSGYPSYVGAPEFRGAIAAWTRRRFGVTLDPATEIASSIGSKEAVFHCAEGFVDPGDVVLVPSPGYPPYTRGTQFAEGRAVCYPLDAASGFLPDLAALPADLCRAARLLWINYPNSPSGRVAPRQFFLDAAEFCRRHNILLCSDEAYTEIYFGDPPTTALDAGSEGVVVFQSLSKRSAMTGWRIGWVAGDRRAIDVFKKVKTNIDSGTPTFIQDAAIAALADEEHVARFRAAYRAKRDLLTAALIDAGLPDCTPEATLYIWQRVPEGMDGVAFAQRLLAPELALVTTPGGWISAPTPDGRNPGARYVRFALVPALDDTRRAAERLRGLRL